MKTQQIIPIFFSVNDAYAPFLAVALNSIKANASKNYKYRIHVLNDDIRESNREKLSVFSDENFEILFISLSDKLRRLDPDGKLSAHSFGAFSSLTIYFRLFIPALFPQYDKGLYLDSDVVVPGDISQLWEEPLGNNLIGACADYSIQHITPFMRYIDEYVGVDHRNYVNSGILVLNMKKLREADLAGRFLHWLREYSLECVAPDQDYLNALCWDRIHYLDPTWDAMPTDRILDLENPRIIHFNLSTKPWLNDSGVPYEDVFWRYAATSGFYDEITRRREAFLSKPGAKKKYQAEVENLIRMAARLSRKSVSFRSLISGRKEVRLCS